MKIEEPNKNYSSLEDIFDSDLEGILDSEEREDTLTPDDRLIRSFTEIVSFFAEKTREPDPNSKIISERKLGARLQGIRFDETKIEKLRSIDVHNLLQVINSPTSVEEILKSPGVGILDDDLGILDISQLPSRAPRVAPEEIAVRVKAKEFSKYKPLFEEKHRELKSGLVKLVPFMGQSTIQPGKFFVLSGVLLFVAEVGDEKAVGGRRTRLKRRTLTVYENGTESSLYSRSLASQLYASQGFEIVPASFDTLLAEDVATGWLYIAKSLNKHPNIQARKNLLKIGFSTRPVANRVANAENEPTYLMAPVTVIAEYRTYNMKTSVLEHLLHRVFAEVRLDINQFGKDGKLYDVTEWFDVPLPVVNQALSMISNGEIVDFLYDPETESLIEIIG